MFHLAGIIPVAGQPLDFDFPWHDSLQPIAKNYLAVERAVVECAHAGCETIWIVCHDDMQPLIRYRLGDYVYDPVWVGREYDRFPVESRKEIPIYYIPIHSKDLKKRDCLGWSILHGAYTIYHVSRKMSKWLIPDRYYVAFPYGVYPPSAARDFRKEISSKKRFFFSSKGKTIKDGEFLGFTFNGEEFINFRKNFRKKASGAYVRGTKETFPKERLPLEKRWSGRNFSLDKIFEIATIEGATVAEVPWYYRVDSWEGLCKYLASEERKYIKRPSKHILFYREFNLIGVDNE